MLYEKIFRLVKEMKICHQIPERSFFINGKQMPVCSRCTGIIIGFFLNIIIWLIGADVVIIFPVCILMIIPLIVDGVVQLFTNYNSNNRRRFITGVIFGLGLFEIIIKICEGVAYLCLAIK